MRAKLLLMIFLAPCIGAADDPSAILLTNHQDGETLRYPVPLLRGKLGNQNETSIRIVNTTSSRETCEMKGLVYKGQFKILTELVPGENKLILKAGTAQLPLTLNYKPQTNQYYIRAIYLTDNTGATEYQTPLDNDPQDYASKIDTALKMMQTFTAERMNDLGFGHRTFNLELDENGKVKLHVFKCPAPAETYYKMNDQAWYAAINSKLEKEYPTKLAKNFVVAAYTRFDPVTQKVQGHTALGGGGQGLFGSGNMFAWPRKVSDIQTTFMDTTPIDPKKVFSDSVGRHTFWAATSTTVGACLHELGHTFGLPHSKEPLDIMTRGIDQFNRAFTFVDPPSARNKEPIVFAEDKIACFVPVSAAALVPSRWFAINEAKYEENDKIVVSLDDARENIVVSAERPLKFVGFSVKGEVVFHTVPKPDEKRLLIPLAQVKQKLKSDDFRVRAIDDQGIVVIENSSKFMPAATK